MKLYGHRGYPVKYPENTILSFEKAIEQGAFGVELDTHFTADKKVIVHHFYVLGHTDNGDGFIGDKTSEYLQSLDVGSWFAPEFAGLKMPLLEEVFEALGTRTHYELELKAYGKEYVDAIIRIVQQYDLVKSITFTSSQYPLLSYLKRQLPNARIGLITASIPDWMPIEAARNVVRAQLVLDEINSIHAPLEVYTEDFVKELKDRGISVHYALIDDPTDLLKARDLGGDEVTTNDVALAVETLSK